MPDEEYITVSRAAELSGLTSRHVRWLLAKGVIPGIKPGHDWLVKPSAVMDYLRQERKPGRRSKSQGKQ
jgi:excisionase family DNA binding protein